MRRGYLIIMIRFNLLFNMHCPDLWYIGLNWFIVVNLIRIVQKILYIVWVDKLMRKMSNSLYFYNDSP